MPVILVTQEAEIRRITVRNQPRQIDHETLSRKNSSQKRAGGVAQGVGPEFKPSTAKKKEKLCILLRIHIALCLHSIIGCIFCPSPVV
jgi:hypothetical protein